MTKDERVGRWLGKLIFSIGIGCLYSWSPSLAIGWLTFALIGQKGS